jgi:dTDP-4-dehydrorhamnose reductase
MRILVTGVKGQLGYDCVRELHERGFTDVIGIDKDDLDITDERAVHEYVRKCHPDVIMHNAAWTAVDKAEQFKFEVYKVNALGPKYLTDAAREVGAKIVYISTDYVFPGEGDHPYEVDDPVGPKSTYGLTKWQGEEFVRTYPKHFIVRTSWVFGKNGHNFIQTMLKLAETHKEISVVDDQIGSPTYTYDLSKLLCDMIMTDKYGTYHATNEGYCSWADFAEEIFKIAHKDVKVNRVTTEEYLKLYPNQAARPLNSRLSKDVLANHNFKTLPKWQNALGRYLVETKKE